MKSAIARLEYLCPNIPDVLRTITEEEYCLQKEAGKWSKKQILGHLIDSAANNHHRFVRIQYEEEPTIYYNQDEWNRLHNYQIATTEDLIQFWESYNLHLLRIIKNISSENLERTGFSRAGEKHQLSWYISDYVHHMEHHLRR